MQLVLTEDQELISKTARDFMEEKSPISRARALRDDVDGPRFSRELWKEMAELGWLGIPFPESAGGVGMGLSELAVVMEAAGRKLAPEPFLSSLLLGGQALLRGGSEAQLEAWLPEIISGDKIVSLAFQEKGVRFDHTHVTTRAESSGSGWRITGEKAHVLDGDAADALVVVARTNGGDGDASGISLFIVPADAAGLEVEAQRRLDSRGAAHVRLAGVEVGAEDVVGAIGGGADLLETVLDIATVGLCAEMLGGMSEAFESTLEYMKERVQFGAPIGSFQALQHRAARVFMEIELSRSVVMAAARGLDAGEPEAQKLVSLAKARCSDAYVLVGNEGVQIFGGVGMTDEYDIGLFLKRARATELTLGDAAWHRARWARLSEY